MIAEEINNITSELPIGVKLIAVSKFHPVEALMEAYGAGQRLFGENKVQEMTAKHEVMPKDIEWHFIGHLQTNKVKYIAPYISLIHSVDTPRLLHEINRQGMRFGRRIPCLLQLHVAQEETKFGFLPEELTDFLRQGEWRSMDNVEIRGLMCMASNVDDKAQIAREFSRAHAIYNKVRDEIFPREALFCERSWGMSDDFPIALQHGSTLVRIGSRIFGHRV